VESHVLDGAISPVFFQIRVVGCKRSLWGLDCCVVCSREAGDEVGGTIEASFLVWAGWFFFPADLHNEHHVGISLF